MPSTKTRSRGPRELARKKRAANQLRKIDFHQERITELEAALHDIQELILDNADSQFDLRVGIFSILKQVLKNQ